jgi:hypothetical protein
VPEPTTTEGASETNPATAGAVTDPGSVADGAAGGSQTDAGSLATDQVAAAEARARSWQARADRLQAELAAAQAGTSVETPAATGPITADAVADVVWDALADRDRLTAAYQHVREKFPNAHPSILQHVRDYESPEAFVAAAAESHTAETGWRQSLREQMDAEIRQQYGIGDQQAPATPAGAAAKPAAPTGKPTLDEVRSMDSAEMDQLEKEHPGHIESLLREASADGKW